MSFISCFSSSSFIFFPRVLYVSSFGFFTSLLTLFSSPSSFSLHLSPPSLLVPLSFLTLRFFHFHFLPSSALPFLTSPRVSLPSFIISISFFYFRYLSPLPLSPPSFTYFIFPFLPISASPHLLVASLHISSSSSPAHFIYLRGGRPHYTTSSYSSVKHDGALGMCCMFVSIYLFTGMGASWFEIKTLSAVLGIKRELKWLKEG